jgi:hypothetical protein
VEVHEQVVDVHIKRLHVDAGAAYESAPQPLEVWGTASVAGDLDSARPC